MKKLTKAIFVLTLAIAAAAEAKLAPPKLEDYTHVCKKCGGATWSICFSIASVQNSSRASLRLSHRCKDAKKGKRR